MSLCRLRFPKLPGSVTSQSQSGFDQPHHGALQDLTGTFSYVVSLAESSPTGAVPQKYNNNAYCRRERYCKHS